MKGVYKIVDIITKVCFLLLTGFVIAALLANSFLLDNVVRTIFGM